MLRYSSTEASCSGWITVVVSSCSTIAGPVISLPASSDSRCHTGHSAQAPVVSKNARRAPRRASGGGSCPPRPGRGNSGVSIRPVAVTAKAHGHVYGATFADYRDNWEPNVWMIFPGRMTWTLDGKPLADLTVTYFRSNPYIVFPVPDVAKQK